MSERGRWIAPVDGLASEQRASASDDVVARSRSLAGFTVGITGHRRWEEQAEMLTRRGARVVHGATMATQVLGDLDATIAATRAVMSAPVDTVLFTTGIGVRSWFAAAQSVGMDDELRGTLARGRVMARGPKALNAARSVGLDVDWTAAGETNDELLALLRDQGVAGTRVVVQRDGGAPLLAGAVRALGPAEIVDIPVYEWHVPDDPSPALRLLEMTAARQVDAVTFTSSYAVHNAFELSSDPDGLADAFAGGVVATAVGPVTAHTLRSRGVARVLEPTSARLGPMIHALAAELEGRARVLRLDAVRRRWQGGVLLDDDGAATELTRGEARLLSTLVARAPTVVPKVALVEHGSDEHAAEAAIARLRAKLGPLGAGIRTVRRRGYACALAVERPAPTTSSGAD
ncbi:MAG: uroporphyrinogen-III synthase [Ilumatobacteraceae bacterium]